MTGDPVADLLIALATEGIPVGFRAFDVHGTVHLTGRTTTEAVSMLVTHGREGLYRRVVTARSRRQGEVVGGRYAGVGWADRAASAMVREAYRSHQDAVASGYYPGEVDALLTIARGLTPNQREELGWLVTQKRRYSAQTILGELAAHGLARRCRSFVYEATALGAVVVRAVERASASA